MKSFVKGLEVELHTTAGLERQSRHLVECGAGHRTICLPANAKDIPVPALSRQLCSSNGVFYLARRVASEEADAARWPTCRASQLRSAMAMLTQMALLEVPVLAEKAIESASLVEDSQIVVAQFRPLGVGELRIAGSARAGADPVGQAVGW